MYCIYSGKEIDTSKSNIEHIIPLSLGGCDEFTIQVEKDINSKLGSRIDGKLTQDFLIALNRVYVGEKGHSKKEPIYNVPSTTEGGEPLISTFTNKSLLLFDPKERKYVDFSGKISLRTMIDMDLRIKFATKVTLATGFFLFGKAFENYTDCEALRMIVNSEHLKDLFKENPDRFEGMRFYDSLHEFEKKDAAMMSLYKMYCKHSKKSNVLWTYSPESIIVHVAILGEFVGLINCKANIGIIPPIENDWLGHIMICDGDKLERKSWREALLEVVETYGLLPEEEIERAKKFAEEFE